MGASLYVPLGTESYLRIGCLKQYLWKHQVILSKIDSRKFVMKTIKVD